LVASPFPDTIAVQTPADASVKKGIPIPQAQVPLEANDQPMVTTMRRTPETAQLQYRRDNQGDLALTGAMADSLQDQDKTVMSIGAVVSLI
jgi:hypothetical protein